MSKLACRPDCRFYGLPSGCSCGKGDLVQQKETAAAFAIGNGDGSLNHLGAVYYRRENAQAHIDSYAHLESVQMKVVPLYADLAGAIACLEAELARCKNGFNALNGAYDSLHENHIRACDELARLRAALSQSQTESAALREALERIRKDIPAVDQGGGMYVEHHSPDGEFLGAEYLDPAAVLQNIDSICVNALR